MNRCGQQVAVLAADITRRLTGSSLSRRHSGIRIDRLVT